MANNSVAQKNKKPAQLSGLFDGIWRTQQDSNLRPLEFVAEYSIQLSYESVVVVLDQVTTG